MISDILSLLDFLDKKLADASIMKAMFTWDGTRTIGDTNIAVNISGNPKVDKIWFYQVTPYKDFIFVPIPVNPAVNIDFGIVAGQTSPDSNIFRYVASPLAKFASGGEENVKVDFMVFGYKPSDLMELKSK